MQHHFVRTVRRLRSELKPKLEEMEILRKQHYQYEEEEAAWKQHTQSTQALLKFLKANLAEIPASSSLPSP